MPSPGLSATLITLNEADKITATLEALRFADEIIVVDSGSTDGTVEIARRLGARVVHQDWLGFGRQKNFAASLASHEWVLNIDADEVVTPELALEIQAWLREQAAVAPLGTPPGILAIPRKTFFGRKWIRFGGWYPNAVRRLGHRRHSRWTEPELHESLVGEGVVTVAQNPLLHFSFDSIADQVQTNLKYARHGSRDLHRSGRRFSWLRLVLKPVSKFIECYFWKLGMLDGKLGLVIAVNAAHSMFLKQAFLLEEKDGEKSK